MKTYLLEKATIYNDGTLGQWEVSSVANTPEIWHDYETACVAAEKRDARGYEGCAWRVQGDELW